MNSLSRISRPTMALAGANLLAALVVMAQLLYPATAGSAVDVEPTDGGAALPDFAIRP